MVIFIDTSSLVKRYIEEKGSNRIDDYYKDDNDIVLSPITPIEFHSALKRKLIENTISHETYTKALREWYKEEPSYNIIAFNKILVFECIKLIDCESIKTLDSIQLSCAKLQNPDEFVTSDRKLYKLAKKYLSAKITFI